MLIRALPLLALPALALAQQAPNPDAPVEPAARAVSAAFTLHGSHTFSSDFQDLPGNMSVSRFGADLDMVFPVGDADRLVVGLTSEFSWYSFDEATGFAPGTDEPFDDLMDFGASALYHHKFNDRWNAFAGGGLGVAFENGADFSDSLTYQGVAGATYSFSPRLTLGGGVRVATRIEESVLIVPIVVIDYQFADKWSLKTGGGLRSYGVALSYAPCDTWTLTGRVGVEARSYRLDDDNPSSADGVARDWRIPVAFDAAWKVNQQVTLTGTVGVAALQEITLDDRDGDELAQDETEPALFVGAMVRFEF